MSQLVSISNYCGFNPPGLVTVEYLPTTSVDRDAYLLIPDSSWKVAGVPLDGGTWLTLPFLPTGKNWNERQQDSPNNPYYEQQVQGITPLLRHEVNGQFDAMARYRFLLRIKDRQGKLWLIGTLEEPLTFFSNGETGDPESGLNHYQIGFVGNTSKRAYGIQE